MIHISRKLTLAEIDLSREVYGDLIDYNLPRIIPKPYFFWQPKGILVAPNGCIYMNAQDYKADYALASESWKRIFIHEMAHVLQFQKGINVLFRGALLQIAYYASFKIYNPYSYTYKHGKRFETYNVEQQGDIARDIYLGKIPNIIMDTL